MGNPRSGWQYEALGAAVPLGLDTNFAHVQPDGNYHYHGLPTGLMRSMGHRTGQHSPLIGWAADGFPVHLHYLKWADGGAASVFGDFSNLPGPLEPC